jgi:hypothetical protein
MMAIPNAETERLLEHPEEYPGLPKHAGVEVLVRTWRNSSLLCSWAILESQGKLFLRRVSVAFNNATYGSEALFDQSVFEQLCNELATVDVAPFRIKKESSWTAPCGIEMTRLSAREALLARCATRMEQTSSMAPAGDRII